MIQIAEGPNSFRVWNLGHQNLIPGPINIWYTFTYMDG